MPTQYRSGDHRPDLYLHAIKTIQRGKKALELSEQLAELVASCRATGKKGTLAATLTVIPIGSTGQYELTCQFNLKAPQFDEQITLMFATPEDNLTVDDPGQTDLDLDGMKTVGAGPLPQPVSIVRERERNE
jgi:hypothetical protein